VVGRDVVETGVASHGQALLLEGFNNHAKLTMRKSFGFRTFTVIELALFHTLGKLPEPESTHSFC